MSDSTDKIRLPLDLLMHRLEQARFPVGQDTWMRVQEVLQKLGSDYLKEPRKLYLILAPVIAKSEAEQEKFKQVFDAYIKEIEEESPPPDPEPSPLQKFWQKYKRRLSVVILLLMIVPGAWYLIKKFIIDIPVGYVSFVIEAPDDIIVDDSFRVKTKPPLDLFADSSWQVTWQFGEGKTVLHESRHLSTNFAFPETGPMEITLKIVPGPTNLSPPGFEDRAFTETEITKNIVVNCRNKPPLTFVEMPTRGVIGDTLRFIVETENPEDTVSFTWDFGDGSAQKPGGEQTHVYGKAGEYIVSLEGGSGLFCKSNIRDTLLIADERDEVLRLTPAWLNLEEPVSFDISSGNSHIYVENEALVLRRYHMDGNIDSLLKPDLFETSTYSGSASYILQYATDPPRLNGVDMRLEEPLNDLQWFGLSDLAGFNQADEIVILDFLGQEKAKVPPGKEIARLSVNNDLKEIVVLNKDGTVDAVSLRQGSSAGLGSEINTDVSPYTRIDDDQTGEYIYLEQLVDFELPLPPEFRGEPLAFARLSRRLLTREEDTFRIYNSKGILLQEFPGIKDIATANIPDYHLEILTADETGRFKRYTPDGMVLPANEPHLPEFKTKRSAIIWTILLSFLLAALGKILESYLEKKDGESQDDESKFTKGPFYARLPVLVNAIHPEKGPLELADAMRQRQAGKRRSLDILKTLKGTIKKGGYPVLFFKKTSRPTEYLFLVDDTPPSSQQVRLFDSILDSLQKEDVLIDKFYFRRHPQNCWNPQHPKGISIDALYQKFPGHRLVIYGEGDFLMDDFEGGLHQLTLKSFSGWKDRAMLSPLPVEQWTYREKLIGREFTLMPSTLSGQLDLIEQIASESRPDFKEIRDRYRQDTASLQHHETLEDIRSELADDRLITWVMALAVYPKPSWEVTLAVGQSLEALPGFERIVTIENLQKLAGLSFMKDNIWPGDLRWELLDGLPFKTEKLAREAVIRLLELAKKDLPENSMASQELKGEVAIQKAGLIPPEDAATEVLADMYDKGILTGHAISAHKKLERQKIWISAAKFIGAFIILSLALTHLLELFPGQWAYKAGIAEKTPFGMPVEIISPDSVFTEGKLTLQVNEDQYTQDVTNAEVVYFDGIPGEQINETGSLKLEWDGLELETAGIRLTPIVHKFEISEIRVDPEAPEEDVPEEPTDDPSQNPPTDDSSELIPERGQNGLYGYRNAGVWVIEPQFDTVTAFRPDGRAYVTKDGVSIQIDQRGICQAGCGYNGGDYEDVIINEKAKCPTCSVCVECIASVFDGTQTRVVLRSPEICDQRIGYLRGTAKGFAKASAEQGRISYCRYLRTQWNLNDRQSTRNNLYDEISRIMGIDKSIITNDQKFRADLGMDELDFVELIDKVEEKSGLTIPDDAARRITEVGHLVEYLVTRRLPPDPGQEGKLLPSEVDLIFNTDSILVIPQNNNWENVVRQILANANEKEVLIEKVTGTYFDNVTTQFFEFRVKIQSESIQNKAAFIKAAQDHIRVTFIQEPQGTKNYYYLEIRF